jgi:hypothetical protein
MSGLTMFQLYLILVLLFFDGMIAVTDHPEWFGGGSYVSQASDR